MKKNMKRLAGAKEIFVFLTSETNPIKLLSRTKVLTLWIFLRVKNKSSGTGMKKRESADESGRGKRWRQIS